MNILQFSIIYIKLSYRNKQFIFNYLKMLYVVFETRLKFFIA